MNFKFSKINGCRLERQGNLPFSFYYGSCGNFNLAGRDIVLLCFSSTDRQTCHK